MADPMPVDDVFRAIAAHRVAVIVACVVGVVAAVALHTVWPTKYEASATYTVEPITSTPLTGDPGRVNMATEQVVATSLDVLTRAAIELGNSSPSAVGSALDVTVPRDSNALTFTYSASRPQDAAEGANAVARAYDVNRTEGAERVVSQARENLAKSIVETQALLNTTPVGSPERAVVELQLTSLQQRLAGLTAATLYAGTLVSPAVEPSESSIPGLSVFAVAGLALGLLLGCALALLLSRRNAGRGNHSAPSGATAFEAERSSASAQASGV